MIKKRQRKKAGFRNKSAGERERESEKRRQDTFHDVVFSAALTPD